MDLEQIRKDVNEEQGYADQDLANRLIDHAYELLKEIEDLTEENDRLYTELADAESEVACLEQDLEEARDALQEGG